MKSSFKLPCIFITLIMVLRYINQQRYGYTYRPNPDAIKCGDFFFYAVIS